MLFAAVFALAQFWDVQSGLRRLLDSVGVYSGSGTNVTVWDIAKALLDYNFHAPTTYFPLLVPECLLIEPTETESKETLDNFVAAMVDIVRRAQEGESFKEAPFNTPVRRLDDVKAARQLDVRYNPDA
jgi:glycine dehydrogenase subunit 2